MYPLPTLMIFDSLGIFSILPILKAYKFSAPIKVYYVASSSFGLLMIRILKLFGVLKDYSQVHDYIRIDTKYSKYFESHFRSFKMCQEKLKKIEEVVSMFFPKLSNCSKELLVAGVQNTWKHHLYIIIYLQFFAEQIAKEFNISSGRVMVVSAYASIMKELESDSRFTLSSIPVTVIQQPFRNRAILLLGWSVYFSFRLILLRLLNFGGSSTPGMKIKNNLSNIAIAAVWGVNTGSSASLMDDLFWLKSSGISNERAICFYDRPDYQPTEERIETTNSLGIQSVVSDHRYVGNSPHLLLDKINQNSIWFLVKNFFLALKWFCRAFFLKELPQSILALSSKHYIEASWLACNYKKLNVKGVIHYQQSGADKHALAAELVGACRLGLMWSSVPSGLTHNYGTPQVMFAWGNNDTSMIIESGCVSKHVLISGCLVNRPFKEKTQKKCLEAESQVRKRGANYVLGLFGTSFIVKEFYLFFLTWLLEDPYLGLIVKAKGEGWLDIQSDGLDGLVQKALKTGRIQIIDGNTPPSYVAAVVDFSIGVGTHSAIISSASAVQGARVLFVDFEMIGSYKKATLLDSLGAHRCIFPNFNSVKAAILEYINNPECNPHLGNISSIIDHFDPFRDNCAYQRVGEYIGWYLEALDSGVSRDDSLQIATKNYANKCGKDKVALGLV